MGVIVAMGLATVAFRPGEVGGRRCAFVPQAVEKASLANGLDTDEHKLDARVVLGLLHDGLEVGEDISGLCLELDEGVEVGRVRDGVAVFEVEVPELGEQTDTGRDAIEVGVGGDVEVAQVLEVHELVGEMLQEVEAQVLLNAGLLIFFKFLNKFTFEAVYFIL